MVIASWVPERGNEGCGILFPVTKGRERTAAIGLRDINAVPAGSGDRADSVPRKDARARTARQEQTHQDGAQPVTMTAGALRVMSKYGLVMPSSVAARRTTVGGRRVKDISGIPYIIIISPEATVRPDRSAFMADVGPSFMVSSITSRATATMSSSSFSCRVSITRSRLSVART